MIGLEGPNAPKLLITIDEVSKLIDDPGCVWAHVAAEKKKFWRELHSLTRATPGRWVRVVMTGFTDSPRCYRRL